MYLYMGGYFLNLRVYYLKELNFFVFVQAVNLLFVRFIIQSFTHEWSYGDVAASC